VPIPREHLEQLKTQLGEHESRLETLRLQITALEAEAAAHEMMLRLGRNPELLRALNELHDRPELAASLAEDPRSFFEQRRVEVPAGAIVTVTTDHGQPAVEARFKNPPFDYGVGWSRVDGFYLIAAAEPPSLRDTPSHKGN
jgi:hypothetical protein